MKQAIKTEHHVESADGTRYVVRYVNEAARTADLSPVNADGSWDYGEYLTLPLAELRRVTKSKAVPTEGLPETRPLCPFCAKPLRPDLQQLRADGTDRFAPNVSGVKAPPIVKRVFRGWQGYPIERGNAFDKFCTLGCAREFANAAFRAGYRIKRKETP